MEGYELIKWPNARTSLACFVQIFVSESIFKRRGKHGPSVEILRFQGGRPSDPLWDKGCSLERRGEGSKAGVPDFIKKKSYRKRMTRSFG
jgi:hypothetical protein